MYQLISFIVSLLIFSSIGTNVNFVNQNGSPVYLSFNRNQYVSWGGSCSPPFQPGTTCYSSVSSSAGSSRYCASTGGLPDCNAAQNNHQTLVETNFVSNGVWVDISVIPSGCTTGDWWNNGCANTGGASYNLPVKVDCDGHEFVCRGPPGNNGYPTNCGTTNGGCIGNARNDPSQCNQAYFFPAPNLEPVYFCTGDVTITFLDGQ
eukprot:TRINITY_DN176_c0_g1_i1.p1 TRINITY_DN176_c0_g1~~TRINITY_DN176_c0_g1_i1.p1  ORF type:complete len:221 (+),score=45.33 TRINITY_DN176_c0_g1_i1:51-665(+)